MLIYYGVYYGVLGRDFAVLCVDYMAATMTVSASTLGSAPVLTILNRLSNGLMKLCGMQKLWLGENYLGRHSQ